jgi:hypothetical protein
MNFSGHKLLHTISKLIKKAVHFWILCFKKFKGHAGRYLLILWQNIGKLFFGTVTIVTLSVMFLPSLSLSVGNIFSVEFLNSTISNLLSFFLSVLPILSLGKVLPTMRTISCRARIL